VADLKSCRREAPVAHALAKVSNTVDFIENFLSWPGLRNETATAGSISDRRPQLLKRKS
jgi:hypothetical protein